MFKKTIIIIPLLLISLLYIAQEIRSKLFEFKINHQIENALEKSSSDTDKI